MSTGDGTEGSLFKFDFDFGAHPVAAELNTHSGFCDANCKAGIQDPSDNLKRRLSRSHLFGVDRPEAADTGAGDLRNKWCAGNRTHPPTRAQTGPHPYACLDHAGEPLAAYTGTLVFSQHVVSSGDLPFYDVDNLLRDSPYVASTAQWYVLPCVAQAAERCATSYLYLYLYLYLSIYMHAFGPCYWIPHGLEEHNMKTLPLVNMRIYTICFFRQFCGRFLKLRSDDRDRQGN